MISKPWLWLPSKLAHDLAPWFLPGVALFSKSKQKTWRPFDWRGLHFANPMGVAGGVDKSGASLKAWSHLGAGFLEVGTITPEPQQPNPGQIMARDIRNEALWNKMGFPNAGADTLARRLMSVDFSGTPLFINIGKNRWTDNKEAHKDYVTCIEKLKPFADAFVVNVSSPNTKGLRDLLSKEELQRFLTQLTNITKAQNLKAPLLLKLSPDMDAETLTMALEHSAPFVDGWILTNTTKQRPVRNHFPDDSGGLSGRPIQELSRAALESALPFKRKYPEKLLISVGGVNSAEEVAYRLERGADLVQCYSALVFEGPFFFQNALNRLRAKHS